MNGSHRRKKGEKVLQYRLAFLLVLISAVLHGEKENIRFKCISTEQGLSQVTVNCIFQDSKGFMWFGTQDGLNRYDGYEFKVYKYDPLDKETLSDSFILCIHEDSVGALWIGTETGGLNKFNPNTGKFTRYQQNSKDSNCLHHKVNCIFEDQFGILWIGTGGCGLYKFNLNTNEFKNYRNLNNNDVRAICEDKADTLWIGTYGGGLCKFDMQNEQFINFKHIPGNSKNLMSGKVMVICKDRDSKLLWIGTEVGGLYRYNQNTEKFKHYSKLINNNILSIYDDNPKILWIGTEGGGLIKFDKKSGHFTQYTHDSGDPYSLSHNVIRYIYKDNSGVLWIGTYGRGLNTSYRRYSGFAIYQNNSHNKNSLNNNDVRSIYEDKAGVLWIGTYGGLNRFDRHTGKFNHYSHDEADPHSLSNNNIWCILEDRTGLLWIGTRSGMTTFDKKEKFSRFPESLIDVHIRTIYEDRSGIIWIGTYGNGLIRFDRNTEKFTYYTHNPGDPESLSHNVVYSIYEDMSGVLWVGTRGGGLNKFDQKKNKFTHYKNNPDDTKSLSHNFVLCIHEDNAGVLWIGTLGGGLNKMKDREKGVFESFTERDGLPNNVIYGILENKDGNLWMSTNKGISKFIPKGKDKGKRFRNYDVYDGLQSNEFYSGAYFISQKTGEMFFGGINGFNSFFPEDIKDDPYVPPIVITNFFISNKSRPIKSNELKLTHEENISSLSFEFSALHYASPPKNRYKYKLEGWEDWKETDSKNRRATYTNLPSGDYVFHVIGSNKDRMWNKEGITIKLNILPPWWKTWWAYCTYFLFLIGIVYGIARFFSQRSVIKKMKQIDIFKDEIFSNTSHELLTPLNGIIGIAESLLDSTNGKLPSKIAENISMIILSGKRLANLVNDILDFSRLKSKDLKLQKRPVDIRTLTNVVLALSRPLIGSKKLYLVNEIDKDIPPIEADENRLQQIMHNLVGNAIKFTESGKVMVSAVVKEDMVMIHVSDTGIGIPEEKFERIFESFEQINGSEARPYTGSGLGLAITKQLVELHDGKIWVESTVNNGSIFTFTLPIYRGETEEEKTVVKSYIKQIPFLESFTEHSIAESLNREKHIESMNTPGKSNFNILIVDDDPINRRVIRCCLFLQNYNITEASSGYEALKMLKNDHSFDLVLLDIMMPRMSGYEVCQKIRERWSPNELPIIFLTAKNQEKNLVDAFYYGGSDFISKPVSKSELIARVKTHLKLKKSLLQLIHSARMAVLATLVAGMSHEINNPNGFAKTSVYNLNQDLEKFKIFIDELMGNETDVEVKAAFDEKFNILFKHLATIEEGISRIDSIVKDLQEFSLVDMDKSKMKLEQPLKGLKKTLKLVKGIYNNKIDFVTDFQYNPEIICNQAELNQVFMIIIVNAYEAILKKQKKGGNDSKGTLTIKTLKNEKSLLIVFKDTGIGMTQKVKQQIFEPFFTTKQVREGTGLGLSIAHGIIEKHQGKIEVESKEGKSTTITLYLPITGQSAEAIDRR